MSTPSSLIEVHPSVSEAIAANRPVVALESTLISHGLPRPRNLEVAHMLEALVREAGAEAATIAIVNGRLKVGLDAEELEALAMEDYVRKCSRRDLGVVAARGEWGATTVATTMWAAHQAGIRFFATGGIGGVHRRQPFDVSADLDELAQTPVLVVSAGAKAILDLPLTLEALETRGVPVLGYRTGEFPAFYTRTSGLPVDATCHDPEEVAAIAEAHWGLGLPSGILLAAPIPEEAALETEDVDDAILRALSDAEVKGIRGKAVTPFLLGEVARLTGERSLHANIALLQNNVLIAASVAKAWCTRSGGADE